MKHNIILIFIIPMLLFSQSNATDGLTCAFWNVENLFDLLDDPNKNDEEFAIGGKKNVDEEIYNLKLKNMSEVLTDLNADILGLCEVENRFVLEQLNSSYSDKNYSIVHYDSPDNRGIDVALLYDSEKFEVLYSEAVPVVLPDNKPTRDILYVKGITGGKTLHIFVNHWPSKYGGAEATIPLRAIAGKTLRHHVDTLLEADPNADIVIMGDLNDEPFEPSIVEHLGADLYRNQVPSSFALTNLMTPIHDATDKGTYMYRGKHNVIDHIIVSRGLFDNQGWTSSQADVSVLDMPKYRQQTGDYKDYPFRFWAGNNLLGGYSDHLAVMIKLYPPK
ncbi:MAG: endonuclease/exonuclease/phosphatase family protein [Candidatus Marinimicrobia bacterium]|nr:endonuclease/exonuclease/phosphatase family protein [Candidatus Neomarinimicrobiota bacterium]